MIIFLGCFLLVDGVILLIEFVHEGSGAVLGWFLRIERILVGDL